MSRDNLSKNVVYLVLILSLIFVPAAANGGRKKEPSPRRGRIEGPGPENDLKKVESLVAKYKQELPKTKGSRDYILTNLSHLCWILGVWGEKKNTKNIFEEGRGYAKVLCKEKPNNVAGHYWLAMNLGGLASMTGNLRLVPLIVKEMKIAVTLDEKYNQAGPHRVLGRIYCKAPPWPVSVGDLKKSLKHLRRAVNLFPNNSTNRLYLAETLYDLKENDQACRQFKKVLSATDHANWTPSLLEDQQMARELVGKDCTANNKQSSAP